jgi:hypothetical protein
MEALLNSLWALVVALWDVVVSTFFLLLPWTALFAWIIFWMCGVNWTRLRSVLLQGGIIAVVLIGLIAALCWGLIAPPPDGYHVVLGLHLTNFVGKIVFVTGLICIMLLSGAVQLAGGCSKWCHFDEEPGRGEDVAH